MVYQLTMFTFEVRKGKPKSVFFNYNIYITKKLGFTEKKNGISHFSHNLYNKNADMYEENIKDCKLFKCIHDILVYCKRVFN